MPWLPLPQPKPAQPAEDVPVLPRNRYPHAQQGAAHWYIRTKPTNQPIQEDEPIQARRKLIHGLHIQRWLPKRRAVLQQEDETTQHETRVRRNPAVLFGTQTFAPVQWGRYRVANDNVEGYVIYIGRGQMPDFTQAPQFASGLPANIAITPPGSGTLVLWVVKRYRDKYGLESQNTQPQFINIDSSGNEVLGLVSTPVILDGIAVEDENFLIFTSYPGLATDKHPADTWRLYVGQGTPPVPGVDTPAYTGSIVGSSQIGINVGPYHTGGVNYYFALTVYRTQDGTESAAATFEIDLPADPAVPVPLPGAFTAT